MPTSNRIGGELLIVEGSALRFGFAATTPTVSSGAGDPNFVVTAPVGSIYLQDDGGGGIWQNSNAGTVWVAIGGAGAGLNVPDGAALTFGTDTGGPLDVVMTADGTDAVVTGTGRIRWGDNEQALWGPGADNVASFGVVQWNSGLTRFSMGTSLINGATALGGSGHFALVSGQVTVTDAATGSDSGMVLLQSGLTDSNHAGATGGDSGEVSVSSGDATSTLGTSGASGDVTITTGSSTDGASGDLDLKTGSAGTTRGNVTVSAPLLFGRGNNQAWYPPQQSVSALTPNVPVQLQFDIADGAATTNFVLVRGIEITDVWVRKGGPNGGSGDAVQVQNGAGAAVTNSISLNATGGTLIRATTIDGGTAVIADGATLRFVTLNNTNNSCRVYLNGFASNS